MAAADELAASWRRTRRTQVFPLHPLLGLLGFLGSRHHLVPASGLRHLLTEHVGSARLEQLPIPLHVVAVDVLTGEEVLLSSGPVVEAVLASAAVPGVLPPMRWGGRELIDGGVADNTPISQAVALGAHEIYVLPTGHACALQTSPGSALGMSLHALSLLMHARLLADIAMHQDHARLVVLPPPCPLTVSPVDFRHAGYLITTALTDARAFLDGGGAARPPIRMGVHQHHTAGGRARRDRIDARGKTAPPAVAHRTCA